MPEEIAVVLVLAMMGGFGLTGLRMFLNYRVKRFSQSGAEDAQRVEGAVEDLREEVMHLRSEMAELGERMDFAERVLSQNREADARKLPGA